MISRILLSAGLIVCCAISSNVSAANKILYSFETPEEIKAWTPDGGVTLQQSDKHVTDGRSSLKVTVAPSQWNGLGKEYDLSEWRDYTYLEFDLSVDEPTNHLAVLLAFTGLCNFNFQVDMLKAAETRHIRIPIKDMDQMRVSKSTNFKVFSCNVDKQTTFYLDNLHLTGDNAVIGQLRTLKASLLSRKTTINLLHDKSITKRLLALQKDVDLLLNNSNPNKEECASIVSDYNTLLFDWSKAALRKHGIANPEYTISFESPMHKVRSIDSAADLTGQISSDTVSLSAAKNEYENLQMVIVPFARDLTGVNLQVSDMVGPMRSVLSSKNIEVRLAGEVDISGTNDPQTKVLTGRYPDPLQPLTDSIQVDRGVLKSIWLTAYVPSNTPAGLYRGSLTIKCANSHPYKAILNLRVRDFTLPRKSSLKTLFCLHAYPLLKFYSYQPCPDQYNILGTTDHWDFKDIPTATIHKWLDYAEKYRISLTSVFGWSMYIEPFWPITKGDSSKYDFSKWNSMIEYAVKHQTNAITVVGVPPRGHMMDPASNKQYTDLVKSFMPQLEKNLISKNWANMSYTYLPDEPGWLTLGKEFLNIAKIFKEAAPRIKTLATTSPPFVHPAYPELTKYVDTWVPMMDTYPPSVAAELRKQGKEVWWYTCLLPFHPYPHLAIYQSGIDPRMIPLLSWKYKVDGYLSWGIDVWPDASTASTQNPKWPAGDWTFKDYLYPPGDGYMMYPGPNGQPWSSVRMENFRDGMEDYEYLTLLKNRLSALDRKGISSAKLEQLKSRIRKLLEIDQSVIVNPIDFTQNPETLSAYRSKLADAIEQSAKLLN